MLANICANVVRGVPAPVYVAGSSLLLDAGQASSYSTGATWADISGNALDYTWSGGYGRGSSGATAYFTLNGSTAEASRANRSFYGSAQTWSGWAYATSDVTQRFLSEDLAGNQQLIITWTGGGNLSWAGYDITDSRFSFGNSGGASGLSLNTWYNFAGTYDGSNAYLYVNGVQAATAAQTGGITAATTTFYIGRLGLGGQYWNGRIAQVILYPSALTAAEVKTNFNAVCTRYGYSPI